MMSNNNKDIHEELDTLKMVKYEVTLHAIPVTLIHEYLIDVLGYDEDSVNQGNKDENITFLIDSGNAHECILYAYGG